MNDCLNADIRDQLPDLLHGRLDEAARIVVDAHVAACVDCHGELELLRSVLGMVEAQTPNIDIAAIVRALPAPPRGREILEVPAVVASQRDAKVVSIASRRRVWGDWRVAAAVTLLVAGGSSAMLLKRSPTSPTTTISAPIVAIPTSTTASASAVDSSPSTVSANPGAAAIPARTSAATPSTVADAEDHANTDLGNGNRLGDLNEQQLQALLNKIDNLPAVPVADPEPVTLHVNSQSSSEGT